MLCIPQCIQQVFSLKLFWLFFQQSYATFNVNVGSLNKRTIRVYVIVKDYKTNQYPQHEKMSLFFLEQNGPVTRGMTLQWKHIIKRLRWFIVSTLVYDWSTRSYRLIINIFYLRFIQHTYAHCNHGTQHVDGVIYELFILK